MDVHDALKKLEASTEFQDWKKDHDGFLAHVFMMLDKANEGEWQFGYYVPSTDRMTTFVFSDAGITVSKELEIVKAEQEIQELSLDEVKIEPEQAVQIAKDELAANYSAEKPLKIFFIIQNISLGHIFNVTFFTESLKTINFKISTLDGKMLDHSAGSLAEFAPK